MAKRKTHQTITPFKPPSRWQINEQSIAEIQELYDQTPGEPDTVMNFRGNPLTKAYARYILDYWHRKKGASPS